MSHPNLNNCTSRLLKCIIQVYSNLGFHFNSLEVTNWKSVLPQLWNILISVWVLYRLLSDDPFLMTHERMKYDSKPLVGVIDDFNLHVNMPLSFTLNTGYFFFFTQRILHTLKFLSSHHSATSKRTLVVIHLVAILSFNVLFVIGWSSIGWKYITEKIDFFNAVLNWACMYIYYLHTLFPLGMVLYIQLALNRAICQIESQVGVLSHVLLIRRLQECARVSRQLSRLTSFPFAVFICTQGFDTLICSCLFATDAEFGIFTYILLLNMVLYGCTCIATKTERQFRNIQKCARFKELRKRNQFNKNKVVKIAELSLYIEDFHLKIFNFFSVDQKFIFQYFLFLLGNTVLLMQTK